MELPSGVRDLDGHIHRRRRWVQGRVGDPTTTVIQGRVREVGGTRQVPWGLRRKSSTDPLHVCAGHFHRHHDQRQDWTQVLAWSVQSQTAVKTDLGSNWVKLMSDQKSLEVRAPILSSVFVGHVCDRHVSGIMVGTGPSNVLQRTK